jgi:hypothetical protein
MRGTPQLEPNMCNRTVLTNVRSFAKVSAGSMSDLRRLHTECLVEEKPEDQENENNGCIVRVVV